MRLRFSAVGFMLMSLIVLMISTVVHAIDVSGSITANTTWRAADSPFVVTGVVDVRNNAVLTIEPGVVVRFESASGLSIVRGTLIARGVVGVPITFTSVRDVSGNTAQPGDWGNIEFGPEASGQSVIERARVAYGRGIKIRQWSGRLENLSIENHLGPAIDADLLSAPAGSNLTATGNLINGITIPSGIIRNNVLLALTGIPYVVQKGWLRVGGEAVFLQPNPLDIEPTLSGEMTLSIAEPAPAGGRTATLTSNLASLISFPPTVLIPAGETEQRFSVVAGANVGNATINAVVPGVGDGSAMVRVLAQPRLVWSGPSSVIVGEDRTLTLSLDPPSATPRVVSIVNSDPTRLTAPTSITVTNNQPVTVRGLAIGAVNLDASTPDYLSASKSLDVRLRTMNWPGGVVVPPGATVSVRVALDTVPVEGSTFMVSSSNPAVATVPAMVTAPASAMHVNVPVTGVSEGTTQLSISAEGYTSATTQATVQIITIGFDALEAKVARGLSEPFRVRLSRMAPLGGLTIDVGSSNTDLFTVSPASVFIPAGATESPTVVDVTGVLEGKATLTASANGLESGVLPVDVLPPLTLQWTRQGVQRVGVGMYSNATATIELRAGDQPYATLRARAISFSVSTPEALSVSALTMLPGSSVPVRLTGLQESEEVELTAQLAGVTSPPMLVQVIKPELQFQSINFNQTLGPPSRNRVESVLAVPGASDADQRTVAARSIALTLEGRDPANIVEGIFNSPTAGTTIVSVPMAANQRQSEAFWVGAPVAAGTYRIGAQSAGLDNALSPVITVTDFELRFNLANSIVGKGLRSSALQVQRYRNGSPFTGGADSVSVIASDSSRLLVPANVGFANGQSSVTVQITGVERSNGVQVTARADGYRDGTVVAQVVDPVVAFSGLDGVRTVGASRDEFRIALQVPGYTGPGQVAANEMELALDLAEVSPAGIVTTIHPAASGSDTISTVSIASGSSQSASRYIGTPSGVGGYKIRATQVGNTNSPWLSAAQSVVSNAVVFSAPSYRLSAGFEGIVGIGLLNPVGGSGVSVALSCEPALRCDVNPAVVTLSGGFSWVTLTGVTAGEATLFAQPSDSGITAGQSAVDIVPLELRFVYPDDAFNNPGYRGFWLEEVNGARSGSDLSINLELFEIDPGVNVEFLDSCASAPACPPVGLTTTTPFRAGSVNSGRIGFGQFDDHVNISDPGRGASWKVRASIAGIGEWISPSQLVIEGPHPVYVAQGLRTPIAVSVMPAAPEGTAFEAGCRSPACSVEGSQLIPAGGSAELRIIPFNPGFTDSVFVSAQRLAPSLATVDIGQPGFHANEPGAPIQVGDALEIEVKLWREDRLQCAANSTINVTISNSDEMVVGVPAFLQFTPGSCSQTFTLNALSAGMFQLEFSRNGFETLTWPEIEVLP